MELIHLYSNFVGKPIKLDLGIILGTNDQLSGTTFNTEKDIVKSIVEKYEISEDDTLIGAIVYGTDAKTTLRFGKVTDAKSALQEISKLQQGRPGNNVLKALEIARDELFKVKNGARNDAAKTLLAFVDADQGFDPRLERASRELREQGIKVIAIEIGSSDSKGSASLIASSEKDAVEASNLDSLKEVVNKIVDSAKPGNSFIVGFCLVNFKFLGPEIKDEGLFTTFVDFIADKQFCTTVAF